MKAVFDIRILPAICLLTLLNACKSHYFVQNAPHIPTTFEKGNARFEGQLTGGPETYSGVRLAGSYNPWKYTHVYANFIGTSDRELDWLFDQLPTQERNYIYRHGKIEGAVLMPIDKYWTGSVSVGLCRGVSKKNFDAPISSSRLDFRTVLLQSALGFHGETAELGVALGVANTNFIGGLINMKIPKNERDLIHNLQAERPFTYPYGGFHFALHYKAVYLTINYGYFFMPAALRLYFAPRNINIGLAIHIRDLCKKN